MKKVRFGMFETNSSSVHTLSFSNRISNDEDIDCREVTIVLGIGEYGWGYEVLTTPLEKMDYLAIETQYSEDKKERLLEAIKQKYPNINITFDYTGEIDHQSEGDVWNGLESEDIFTFLFGESKITLKNDNDDSFWVTF